MRASDQQRASAVANDEIPQQVLTFKYRLLPNKR
jgi:hypothetical protein